jgi:hypothetical protein
MASQQSIHRGLRKMVVAPWNGISSYGTDISVRGARNMSVELTVETDELRGDDVVLDRNTKIIAVNLSIEFATIDLTLFSTIMGGALTENAAYYDWNVGEDDDVPYVGLAGRVVGSTATADLHIFVAKAKLSSNLALGAQLDTYMIPTATFQGVDDGGGVIARLRNFTAPTALEIPLKTTTGL